MTDNLTRILESATIVFNDEAKATDWIEHMSATLGASPRDLSATDEGTERVLLHLRGIERHTPD
jgi:uncharacterized protein (DUF2384 family)